jgi:methionine biosynthesis protein MetW
VVSFPNFAYRSNRAAIAAGHMPVSEDLPYDWFDTPNVRFFTIFDFEDCVAGSASRFASVWLSTKPVARSADDPNLNGSLAFYRLGRKS